MISEKHVCIVDFLNYLLTHIAGRYNFHHLQIHKQNGDILGSRMVQTPQRECNIQDVFPQRNPDI